MRITARVPATAANLGPGFDCLALALDLCNEFTVDTAAGPAVSWEGEGRGELPTDGSDMVSVAMRRVAEEVSRPLPAFAMAGRGAIPLERGLGSSASAAVAGVALAGALLGLGPDAERDLAWAASIEGHPDNVAAATFGGLTLAWDDRAIRVDPSPELRPVALVPGRLRIGTKAARDALPDRFRREDAVHNIGRAALAVVALTQRTDLLREALADRLHQEARLALVPEARDVFELVRGAGLPVCVSGSGPTLIAFERDGRAVPDPGNGWRVLRVPVRTRGVEVLDPRDDGTPATMRAEQ